MKIFTLIISFLLVFLAYGQEISKPYASGKADGDLKWELRFNLPVCDHPGKPINAWCKYKVDGKKATKISGVETKLKTWINDKKIKSLYLSYFSFSNAGVKKSLCEGVKKRKDLTLNIYINYSSYEAVVAYFKKCGNNKNVNVYSRGKGPFGTPGSHLQHSKIFLALETKTLKSLPEVSGNMALKESERRIRFTSSSANMSSFGTNIYFENWLFFNALASDYVAQQNICAFRAFGTEVIVSDDKYRKEFKKRYSNCVKQLVESRIVKKRSDMTFYFVPSYNNSLIRKPYKALKKAALNAKKEVLVAIHRLGSRTMTRDIFKAISLKHGVDFKIIFDDDTLRSGKKNGGPSFDVGEYDVLNYRMIRRYADVYLMETNACTISYDGNCKAQLFHNKFIVIDDTHVFQGAGNFTASALNTGSDTNFEQFYLITDKNIVKAYKKAWYELQNRATAQKNHEVFRNKDRAIDYINGRPTFLD